LQVIPDMFGRKKKGDEDPSSDGTVDGGEGRGVPLGGHDERPPTGYRSNEDDDAIDLEDRDFLWEEGDPADRRKDPLRKP
jgi:hypothetical protein